MKKKMLALLLAIVCIFSMFSGVPVEAKSCTVGAYMLTNKNSSMPQTGTAKTVFFLVQFPDAKNAQSNLTADTVQKMYFDEKDENSLSGFYQKSSFGSLHIRGSVYGWYTAKQKRDSYAGSAGNLALYKEVISYYDSQGVNFANFDGDKDGIIDCVYLLFAGGDTGYGSSWWNSAGYLSDSAYRVDGKRLGSFIKLSSTNLPTAIHETGHALGLWDYYSVDETGTTVYGIGGHDIMDDSTGDHNALSKLLLGWMTPQVVLGSNIGEATALHLNAAKDDCVVFFPGDTEDYQSEYYVIELLADYNRFRVLHINGTDANGRLKVSFVEADANSSVSGNAKWTEQDLFDRNEVLSTGVEQIPYILFVTADDGTGIIAFVTAEEQTEDSQTISCNAKTLLLKRNTAFTPTVTNGKGISINKKMNWISTDPSILSVSESGKITAKKAGHGAVIGTYPTSDSSYELISIDVYVVSGLSGISFTPSNAKLTPGKTAAMSIMVGKTNLTHLLNITWGTSNSRISVSKKGKVAAQKVGLSTVKATLQGGIILTYQFTVDFAAVKVKAAQTSAGNVYLKWNEIKGATGYRIYRYNYTTKADPVLIATVKKGSTITYTDKKVKSGVGYAYQVFAFDASQSEVIYSQGSTWVNIKVS